MSRRRKKKNNNSILILLFIIFLFICGYFIYNKYLEEKEKNKLQVTLKDNLEVEINSEVSLSSLVLKVENGEIINGDELLDTSILGVIKKELLIKNNNDEEEKYEFTVKVVDTTKPEIEGKKEITSYVGEQVNLLEGIKVTDNSQEEITPKVIGDYDSKKTGTYKLKYVATDSSGNTREYDFILNIISDPNNRTFTTSKGFSAKVVNGITYIDGILIANKTYSLPSSYAPGLLNTTKEAFNKLNNDSKSMGYNFYIGSGYRSYYTQQTLYNNYVKRDGQSQADTYSARAGHSEHQTGLAFDICDYNLSKNACISSGFDNTEQAKWISNNCYKYGLIIRYPKGKEQITGYMYESWHLRYVGIELATKLYNDGNWITLEEYYGIDSKYS